MATQIGFECVKTQFYFIFQNAIFLPIRESFAAVEPEIQHAKTRYSSRPQVIPDPFNLTRSKVAGSMITGLVLRKNERITSKLKKFRVVLLQHISQDRAKIGLVWWNRLMVRHTNGCEERRVTPGNTGVR
eukprot:401038-Amorphochlora_amoeboformis.AAC.2